MKKNKLGFTLIELLVVVLIIGVLAAIALPMYQKAVLKSRFSALMPIAKAMAESNEAYYLEHGEYAYDTDDLPVQGQMDYPDGTELEFGTTTDYAYVLVKNEDKVPNNYIVYQKHSGKFADNIHCEAEEGNVQAQEICTSLGGQLIDGSQTDGFITYLLSGNIGADKLPTSLAKLQASICGEKTNCSAEIVGNNVVAQECGSGSQYMYSSSWGSYGCIITKYDANGDTVGTEHKQCRYGFEGSSYECARGSDRYETYFYANGHVGTKTCREQNQNQECTWYQERYAIPGSETLSLDRDVQCRASDVVTAQGVCSTGNYLNNEFKVSRYGGSVLYSYYCRTYDENGQCSLYGVAYVASGSAPTCTGVELDPETGRCL